MTPCTAECQKDNPPYIRIYFMPVFSVYSKDSMSYNDILRLLCRRELKGQPALPLYLFYTCIFSSKYRYQCCGSMTFWCGSGSGSGSADPCLSLMDPDPDPGSGSCYFRHRPSRCQQKTIFLFYFFLLITF